MALGFGGACYGAVLYAMDQPARPTRRFMWYTQLTPKDGSAFIPDFWPSNLRKRGRCKDCLRSGKGRRSMFNVAWGCSEKSLKGFMI